MQYYGQEEDAESAREVNMSETGGARSRINCWAFMASPLCFPHVLVIVIAAIAAIDVFKLLIYVAFWLVLVGQTRRVAAAHKT